MRKLSIPLLSVLCASLLSCERATTQTEATATDDELVVIAPRIVRTALITDDNWNATAFVHAYLYDSEDKPIPNMSKSAAFASHQITLPAIDPNTVVSVYASGTNAAGTKIWEGWTDWHPAKNFSTGVGIGTSIPIKPSKYDSLVGTWRFINKFTLGATSYTEVYALVVKYDGTYSINYCITNDNTTIFTDGYLETGSWSASQHDLTVTPTAYLECRNTSVGCDVSQFGTATAQYTTATAPATRRFVWSYVGNDLFLQDKDVSSNSQQWTRYSP